MVQKGKMLKGLFCHIFAKAVFVLCTYLIHLYLGKSLSPATYGTIGVVISIITVNYNFLTNGARQAVSKLLSSKQYNELNLIKRSVLTQTGIAFILTAINYLGADYFAKVLNAPEMGQYIRLSALIIPFTAGYFLCIGIINGLKLFTIEAFIVTIYPLFRLTVIPYVEFIFADSTIGTVMGFFTAALICCMGGGVFVFFKRSRFVKRQENVSSAVFYNNMTNFLIFFTCITIILNADIFYVNALVDEEAYVGYYTGAVNFAKVSYYLLSAIYIMVLPMLSQFYAQKKINRARETINVLNEAIVLLIMPIVTIVGATTAHMLTAFYKPEYKYATLTATILMFSQFFIGLFVVYNMCISATKKNSFSTVMGVAVTTLDLVLCYILVKHIGIKGAATASLIAGFMGWLISCLKVKQIYGNVYSKSVFLLIAYNIMLFMILYFGMKFIIIENIIILLIFYAIVYFAFIGIIILTKQIDIKKMIRILSTK